MPDLAGQTYRPMVRKIKFRSGTLQIWLDYNRTINQTLRRGELNMQFVLSGTGMIMAAIALIAPTPALSQVRYGPWQSYDCESIKIQGGPGQSPSIPQFGRGGEMCNWKREVVECPRIRDKVTHPLACARRVDYSRKKSPAPPRD